MAGDIVKQSDNIRDFLMVQFKPIIKDYATRAYNEDAWLKSAMMCIVESEELQKCLATPQGKASLVHALRYAAATGLSLNPQEGKAALIPYAGKVEYQVMKGGMIALAMASGKVEFITADTVYENDDFQIEKTMDGDTYRFKPALKDRGDALGYFAALRMTSGTVHVKWIDKANMEKHRDHYAKGLRYTHEDKAKGIKKGELKPNHAWVKSFDGMSLKTVLKALLRSLEISPELTSAVVSDDRFESGEILDVTPRAEEAGASAEDVKEQMAEVETEEAAGTSEEPPQEKTEKDLF